MEDTKSTKDIQEACFNSVLFVRDFYDVTEEVALLYYKDEIEAYENLRNRFDEESNFEKVLE